MFCRCARPLWTTDHVFSDTTENESFLPSARPSAQPDLSVPPSTPLMECLYQTHAAPLPASAAIKRFDFFFNYFIAAELSWNSGEDLHIHTLPLSRGEEEEVTAEGSLTPVSGYELLLVKLHWYKHPLSWYIFFILYLLISIWQYQKSFKLPFQYFSEICFLRTFCLMCP